MIVFVTSAACSSTIMVITQVGSLWPPVWRWPQAMSIMVDEQAEDIAETHAHMNDMCACVIIFIFGHFS